MLLVCLIIEALLLQTAAIEPPPNLVGVTVDIAPLADSRITVERIAPYSIVLTNNSARDITGLAVE